MIKRKRGKIQKSSVIQLIMPQNRAARFERQHKAGVATAPLSLSLAPDLGSSVENKRPSR